jgi:hypothetical protein
MAAICSVNCAFLAGAKVTAPRKSVRARVAAAAPVRVQAKLNLESLR